MGDELSIRIAKGESNLHVHGKLQDRLNMHMRLSMGVCLCVKMCV